MKCKKVKRDLSAYLDRQLDEHTLKAIEHHLAECDDCRKSLEALKVYKEMAAKLDYIQAPESLHERIIQQIREQESSIRSKQLPRTVVLLVRAASIAAILIIAFILFVPEKYYQPVQMESDYSLQIVKMGKGPGKSPGERSAESVQLKQILDIAAMTDGRIIKDGYNEQSGLTDFVTVRIRRNAYETFRVQYNLNRTMDTLPSVQFRGVSMFADIQIYIPGRKIVACDLNGDGYQDMIVHYRQGRHAGEWYGCLNDSSGHFRSPERVMIHDTLKYLPEQAALLSGDMDGDLFDDLIVQQRLGGNAGKWYYYLNDHRGGFNAGELAVVDGEAESYLGINVPLVGDMNGDGLADIGAHYRKGEMAGKWVFSLNRGNGHFEKGVDYSFNLQGTGGENKYLPVVLDFNGDGKDDGLVYWQAGPLCPKWFVSINLGNNQFGQKFQVSYSLQGDYSPYTGDFNGDGLDDFCTKTGTPDEVDEWFLMINEKGERLIFMEQPTFGDYKDITIIP